MSLHEVYAGYEWLYGALSGDSTLSGLAPGGVHRALAPVQAVPPFVVMIYQSGADSLTQQAVRVLTQPLYQVKAVGPASITATLVSAANEIDVLLKRASGSVSGGYIAACYRESPLSLDNMVNGEQWTEIGGLYRTQIQQTT